MNVGIIGCGAVGYKRAMALPPGCLRATADNHLPAARKLAEENECIGFPDIISSSDYFDIITRDDIDAVIIATPHNILAKIALDAIKAGKYVLIEKPGAINHNELASLIPLAKKNHVKVTVGYTLRFHPAIQKAKGYILAGDLGEIMYIRGHYGHGGRPGYDREWRAIPEISGGGVLMDMGVHLIDLSRWFLGRDPYTIMAYPLTCFWHMPVEDNAFIYIENHAGTPAWLHASCTEWKNSFQFEIFCTEGKLQIDGIGDSYGTESLTLYQMLPGMGPPATTRWEYPSPDNSWKLQWEHFEHAIKNDTAPSPSLEDAYEVLKIVKGGDSG